MRVRCRSAREVMRRHPWAPPLMESRTSPGPASLGHHDAVLACLRGGGLSWPTTAHAYATLDAFVYGFALQEAALPFGGEEQIGELADELVAALPRDRYPHFAAFTIEHVLRPGYRFGDSFDVGLDLILDGLDARARQEARAGTAERDPAADSTTRPSPTDGRVVPCGSGRAVPQGWVSPGPVRHPSGPGCRRRPGPWSGPWSGP